MVYLAYNQQATASAAQARPTTPPSRKILFSHALIIMPFFALRRSDSETPTSEERPLNAFIPYVNKCARMIHYMAGVAPRFGPDVGLSWVYSR